MVLITRSARLATAAISLTLLMMAACSNDGGSIQTSPNATTGTNTTTDKPSAPAPNLDGEARRYSVLGPGSASQASIVEWSDGSFRAEFSERAAIQQNRENGLTLVTSAGVSAVAANMPLAGPDAQGVLDQYNDASGRFFAASARIASESGASRVVEVDGRPVTRASLGAYRFDIDNTTGVTIRRDGPEGLHTATNLSVGARKAGDLLAEPGGTRSDGGYIVTAEPAPSYRLPDVALDPGYALTLTQYRQGRVEPVGFAMETRPNPPSSDVVIRAYRKGFDEVVVTTRLIGETDPASWGDLYVPHSLMVTTERWVPQRGWAAGEQLHVVSGTNVLTHVWGIVGNVYLTVDGYLSTSDIKRIVESLR